jgi:predicted nucleic acid-binding protein
MSKREIVYWDSVCFLALLNNESDKVPFCRGTMQKAENHDLLIVTSAITFIEVIRMKGKRKLDKKTETVIQKLFENSFIHIHNVDRETGIKARELMWKYDALQPKDAIHVATAILRKIPVLHTFDDGLLKLDKKCGRPPLRICKPDIQYQPNLPFFDDSKDTD